MNTRIADMNVVADAVDFYNNKRVRIQYQTMESMPAITVRMRAVRGTNNGRYSVIRPQEPEVGT